MSRPYLIRKILWARSDPRLPIEAVIPISDYLTLSGAEDYEPAEFLDRLEDLDEEEVDEFWDEYEPSQAAIEAFEQEWDREIRDLLGKQFCSQVTSIGGYAPYSGPTRVSLYLAYPEQAAADSEHG